MVAPDVEHVLQAKAHRQVVRVGDTVRRPMYPWSPSVHVLLQHLESVDFPYSPRFLGIDEQDREVLTYREGICGADGYVEGIERGAHVWTMVVPDDGLARFGRLVRDYHDAVAGFVPTDDAAWATGRGAPAAGEIVCHNDLGPWNVVWRDGAPVGIIDWDYAAPGPAVADVAFALEWSVPFCSDEECMRWRRFAAAPDRAARIRTFATAYGLDSIDGLVDAVLRRQWDFYDREVALAERGIQPAADDVADGYLDVVRDRIRWTEDHRHLTA